jgi:hypothetical protein
VFLFSSKSGFFCKSLIGFSCKFYSVFVSFVRKLEISLTLSLLKQMMKKKKEQENMQNSNVAKVAS